MHAYVSLLSMLHAVGGKSVYNFVIQVRQVQADELEVLLTERTVPIIVDFYATWCGPCVLLAKELETVCTVGVICQLSGVVVVATLNTSTKSRWQRSWDLRKCRFSK